VENNLYNIEAEAAVIGTIILNNEYLKKVEHFLKPEHFHEIAHQKIYAHILENAKNSNLSNAITLKQFFRNDDDVSAVGGSLYISDLLAAASTIIDITQYANLVFDNWKLRDLEEAYKSTASKIYKERAAEIKRRLDEHEIDNRIGNAKHISEACFQALSINQEFMNFGYKSVDSFIGGIDAGSLVILAGRPSMGKTTLAINLALSSSKQYSVCFFSLEVKERAIARKVISSLKSYSSYDLKDKKFSAEEIEAIFTDKEIESLFKASKLMLDDEPKQNSSKIRIKIARMAKKGLKMVFIDYLGMIACDKKAWSKNHEIEMIVNDLKNIALEFNIVIVLLCQLNRSLEGRANHKPVLSDLRDSGSIEQTADIVMFVHREEYYLSKAKPWKKEEIEEWEQDMRQVVNKAQIIVAKNRDGETGEIELFFDGKFSRFTEINNF